jgi:hypothetical protein
MADVLELSAVPSDHQYLMWCEGGPGSLAYSTEISERANATTWRGSFDASTMAVGSVMQSTVVDHQRTYLFAANALSVPSGPVGRKAAMNTTLMNDFLSSFHGASATFVDIVRPCVSNCTEAGLDPRVTSQTEIGHTLRYDEQTSHYDQQVGQCILMRQPMEVDVLLFRLTANRFRASEGQQLRVLVLDFLYADGRGTEVYVTRSEFMLHLSASDSSAFSYTLPDLSSQTVEVQAGQYIAWCTDGAGVFFYHEDPQEILFHKEFVSDVPVGSRFTNTVSVRSMYNVEFVGWTGASKASMSTSLTNDYLQQLQALNAGVSSTTRFASARSAEHRARGSPHSSADDAEADIKRENRRCFPQATAAHRRPAPRHEIWNLFLYAQ